MAGDGTYEKSVYRIYDQTLVYRNKANWEFDDGRIVLENFLYDGGVK